MPYRFQRRLTCQRQCLARPEPGASFLCERNGSRLNERLVQALNVCPLPNPLLERSFEPLQLNGKRVVHRHESKDGILEHDLVPARVFAALNLAAHLKASHDDPANSETDKFVLEIIRSSYQPVAERDASRQPLGLQTKCSRNKSSLCLRTFQPLRFDHGLVSRVGTRAKSGKATARIRDVVKRWRGYWALWCDRDSLTVAIPLRETNRATRGLNRAISLPSGFASHGSPKALKASAEAVCHVG
jgi:hypothetical protein